MYGGSLLEMNVDMRKEKNQSALEEEAETLVSIFLPAERTYLATVPHLNLLKSCLNISWILLMAVMLKEE